MLAEKIPYNAIGRAGTSYAHVLYRVASNRSIIAGSMARGENWKLNLTKKTNAVRVPLFNGRLSYGRLCVMRAFMFGDG